MSIIPVTKDDTTTDLCDGTATFLHNALLWSKLAILVSATQHAIFICIVFYVISSTSFSQSPQSPSKPASSWERSAKLVKNANLTNPYLKQVRSEVVNPALQLKTVKDELLCGAIRKVLSRQGEKVLFAIRKMKKSTYIISRIHSWSSLWEGIAIGATSQWN